MDTQHAQLMTTFPMFDGYTMHGIQAVVEPCRIRELAAGDVVFREGDPSDFVVLVLSGKVDLSAQVGGRDTPLRWAGPSRLLGELAVLAGVDRVMSARAAEPTVVLQWDANAFRRLVGSDPNLSQRIFRETFRSLVEEKESLIGSLAAARQSAAS
jgi:CRP-like cAMP-binding protein